MEHPVRLGIRRVRISANLPLASANLLIIKQADNEHLVGRGLSHCVPVEYAQMRPTEELLRLGPRKKLPVL
jgi:hypothetical protein